LRPAIMAGAMLAFITALAQFSIPAIIGKTGNVDVYTTLIYDMLRSYPRQLDSAAVLSSLMVAVTMGVLWYQRRLLRRSSRFVTMSVKGLRRTRLSLGPWRWPLFVGIALYVLITVILPAFALLNVSLRRHWSSTLSVRSEEHTSELQSRENLVCRLLLEKKKSPSQILSNIGAVPVDLIHWTTKQQTEYPIM